MQCHAIVLDTTGTSYARQQPRYVEGEKNGKQPEKKREKKRKEKINTNYVVRHLLLGLIKRKPNSSQLNRGAYVSKLTTMSYDLIPGYERAQQNTNQTRTRITPITWYLVYH